jgi:hypothetical protein
VHAEGILLEGLGRVGYRRGHQARKVIFPSPEGLLLKESWAEVTFASLEAPGSKDNGADVILASPSHPSRHKV